MCEHYNILVQINKGENSMTRKEWSEFLYDNDVYNAYQFISNTWKNTGVALYCKDLILNLISQMGETHQKWRENLFKDYSEQKSNIKRITLSNSTMPNFDITICGTEITIPLLLDKLTKDFFQYIRNSFDCMAQIINAACLASDSEQIERVDFRHMKNIFNQPKYAAAFPGIVAWFNSVDGSNEFSYIEAFNNRTKHISDVYVKLSLAIIGGQNEISINPFIKRGAQHAKQDVVDVLKAVYDFTSTSYHNLLAEIKAVIPSRTFVRHRISTIDVYQQKIKNDEDNSLSMAYIPASCDIANMPDQIEILLLCKIDDDIKARNCPLNTIYIKDSQGDFNFIGKYVASDICGDDDLLIYRKYDKIEHRKEDIPLWIQAQCNPESKNTFYHSNPFMNIYTVGDDEEFLKRIQLPF